MALRQRVVYDQVTVGHSGYCRHLVRYEQQGSGARQFGHKVIDVVLEPFVDIAQRLVEPSGG